MSPETHLTIDKPGRAFEREVAADALDPDFAFDVGDTDIAGHGPSSTDASAGTLTSNSTSTPRPSLPLPYSTRSSTRLPLA